jgi:regulator of replication initiation timing
MTDNLLQKLEEKVITIVTELEGLQKVVIQLRSENSSLKADKENFATKLHNLVSLLDTIDTPSQVQNIETAHVGQGDLATATA